jgi:hypothetical protein
MIINKDILKKILNTSVYAPSGDNCQPWRFNIRGNVILVFNIPDRDTSLYNFKMSASLISIGAVIENIKISADYYGYKCEILLNEGDDSDLVATCKLIETLEKNEDKNSLFNYIKKRRTNRKPYKIINLSPELINEFEEVKKLFEDDNSMDFKIQDNRKAILAIAKASSLNEQIVLENKKLHNFLFDHITWTEEEDEQKKGFFIKTLELKGPQKFIFKILKSWSILKFLNKLSISKLVSKDNAKLYAQSESMLAITVIQLTKIAFIKTGMVMQRLWLVATKHNVYMQPLTGIIFLNNRIIMNSGYSELEKKHVDIVRNSYNILNKELEINDSKLTMLLRIGYADPPTASTKRINPNIEV